MYNVDDAVAKIDGYVISVTGGGPFVGEKKLVRIDEVGAHGRARRRRRRRGRGRRAEEREQAGCATTATDATPARTAEAAASRATPATTTRRGRGGRQSNGSAPPWPQRRTAAFARQGRRLRRDAA